MTTKKYQPETTHVCKTTSREYAIIDGAWKFYDKADEEWCVTIRSLSSLQRSLIPINRNEEQPQPQNPNGKGLKYDAEKPMYNLLPPVAINSLAEVMTFGAKKYQPNSWQEVENGLERYRAALLRHTFAIQRGELIDPESGLHHSAHALACAAFINELEHMEKAK